MTSTDNTPLETRTVSRDHLGQMIDRKAEFTLIEVLDAEKFSEFHLPGAINIPLNDQFETAAVAAVADKARRIVVYCGDKTCDASFRAAQRLSALGYTNIRRFEDGKKGWRESPIAPAEFPPVAAVPVPVPVGVN